MNENLINNIVCSNCGTVNNSNTKFCIKCGASLQPQSINQNINTDNNVGIQPMNYEQNNSYMNQNNFQEPIQQQNNVIYNQPVIQQTSNAEIQNINKNNNKSKKTIMIILIVVALIIAGIFVSKMLFIPSDDSSNNNIVIKKMEGIETKAYISSGGKQLIVSAINKSGKMIGSGYIKVSYYDESGNKIQVYSTDDERYNMFLNNSEIVFGFELPTENYSDYYVPAKTEVEITIDEEYQEQYSTIMSRYTENFTYSYSSTNNNSITLTIKNNGSSEETAPRVLSMVFYKNNKPVYSKEVNFYFAQVQAGQTRTKEIDIPTDYKKSKESDKDVLIDYDSIKIFRILEGSS